MISKQNKGVERSGEILGYTFSYFLFATSLFFILVFSKKLPQSWSYIHIIGVTALIALIGTMVNRFLK